MLGFLGKLISPITSIADKMILDKDKYAELQFKKLELQAKARSELLAVTTTPWIDGFVKLLVTIRDVLIPLMRPVMSALMPVFAGYCAMNGIELGATVETMLFGAPIAYGASRHVDKKQKEVTKRAKMQYDDVWEDED